jgi:hypothetical protein
MFEILDFRLLENRNKVGNVAVRYHDLVMRCELAFYAKERKAWVRMPEIWSKENQKKQYCYWPSKEISDAFQKEILNKIFDKYDLSLDKLEQHYLNARKNLKAKKKK